MKHPTAEINDGGPAFPVQDASSYRAHGMSLRDYFAIHVKIEESDITMSGAETLIGRRHPVPEYGKAADPVAVAQFYSDVEAALRYMRADSMLKARAA